MKISISAVIDRYDESKISSASLPGNLSRFEFKEKARGTGRLTNMGVLLLALILFSSLRPGECFQFLNIDIPKIVDPRQDEVVLRCEYDLGNEDLYSIKWYKDGDEFYTFIPSNQPPGREYPVAGVKVDIGRSDSKQVVLLGQMHSKKKINFAGQYGCEVSVEGPSYSTDFGSGIMNVAVLPHQDPAFEGLRLRSHYDIGDTLEVNCTSGASYPKSNLTFLLNHKEVGRPITRNLPSAPIEGNLVASSRLGLILKLEREHFPGGNLSLICRSKMPGIPEAETRSTQAILTQAASNQRLAQPPPRSGKSTKNQATIFHRILPFLILPILSLTP